MALSSGTALADTSGTGSVGGGNQINLPITLPVDISGNSVAAVGEASASSRGGASVQGRNGSGALQGDTSGRHSVLGGNQINAPITAPINACGNAVSLVGRSDAGCEGGAAVKNPGAGNGAGRNRTDGRHSVLGGNQINAPITAPVNACGNSVAVIGQANSGCRGGASVKNGGGQGAGGNQTSGRSSVLGGNQLVAPITAPINICGNSVAVIGEAFSGCRGGAVVKGGGGNGGNGYRGGPPRPGFGAGGNDTDGRFSVGGGNQLVAPILAPVNVCGNSVGNGAARCEGGISVPPAGGRGGAGGNRTSGRSSILGGNQLVAPITAPVNVCGNAVALIGQAFAGCRGGAAVHGGGGGGAGGNRTDGRYSVLGGNQLVAPITAPINVCGNAVAVLGDAAAGCLGGAHVSRNAGVLRQFGAAPAPEAPGKASSVPGLLRGLPLLPEAPGQRETSQSARPHQAGPSAGSREKATALPPLPVLPAPAAASGALPPAASAADAPAGLVQDVVKGTPAGGIVNGQATGGLPVEAIGLMSAERPAGLTGMNSGSLATLIVGALFAALATVLAGTRRLRRR
ncbi:chaplin family protein [Sphaerisporangium sp. TRM90804]|uniref:chaplin family protein n=1 Tax=Sphaerisporangium sp. TRM90804 TaxID=3031113 RepID=UPI00244AE61F|nr:chaplin family protein [Sphaerisporangium sp. TRM90804]MDH2426481.1 chaplin family protein [Sphaerisporangium sp. TRM90804]